MAATTCLGFGNAAELCVMAPRHLRLLERLVTAGGLREAEARRQRRQPDIA